MEKTSNNKRQSSAYGGGGDAEHERKTSDNLISLITGSNNAPDAVITSELPNYMSQ